MCYSIALRKEREALQRKLFKEMNIPTEFDDDLEFEPYFHLKGYTHGNLQIITMEEPELIHPASWGLVPEWAAHRVDEFRKKSNTLNAKSETIFEKASFKDSARDKRCLILTDGFFEPHHENGVAIPHFCYQPTKDHPEGDLFIFAGLYTEIDTNVYTATILTTEANDFFAEVHNKKKRMPLVLDEFFLEDWIDDITESQLNELMTVGFTTRPFKAHPVSRDLYKKGVDTNKPHIVEEVEKGALF